MLGKIWYVLSRKAYDIAWKDGFEAGKETEYARIIKDLSIGNPSHPLYQWSSLEIRLGYDLAVATVKGEPFESPKKKKGKK